MPFKPGQSGNPKGRPKRTLDGLLPAVDLIDKSLSVNHRPKPLPKDLIDLACRYAEDAIESLHEVAMRAKDPRARVLAACALLDRAFGKPQTRSEVSGPDGQAIQVNHLAAIRLIDLPMNSRTKTIDVTSTGT